MTRIELVDKIETAKQALMFAGPMHHRDLYKHIKRLERELRDYDRFHAEAARG